MNASALKPLTILAFAVKLLDAAPATTACAENECGIDPAITASILIAPRAIREFALNVNEHVFLMSALAVNADPDQRRALAVNDDEDESLITALMENHGAMNALAWKAFLGRITADAMKTSCCLA